MEELLMELGAGHYEARADFDPDGGRVDAILAGLNMLADDLAHSEHFRTRSRELARLNEELERSRDSLRRVLRQLPALVWTVDANLRITSVTGGRLAQTDLTAEDAVGRSLGAWLGDDAAGLVRAHQAAAAGTPGELEVSLWGSTWSISVDPLAGDPSHGATIAVAVDVTATRAEAARLQHSQKLESLGVLAGGIAHDFNNLLVGVLGYGSLALETLPDGAPAASYVDKIVTGARRAAELTRQMLAYSGKGRFVIEAVDLSHLVLEMAELLSVSINKQTTLRYDCRPELPSVEADASQLRQVVMNLITNGSDAIDDGRGVVAVATGVAELPSDSAADKAFHGELEPGRYVFVEVSDTGRGMDRATRARIFDPFFTTKTTGRGLGMAAVLGIVRGHRGAIHVYSEPGRGTRIKVLLPASEAEPTARRGHRRIADTGVRGAVVLVCDDEATVRELARAVLTRAGFEVLTAEHGLECLDLVRTEERRVDLILLDMTMPELGGEETLRRVREIRPHLPVVMTSGYNEQEATNRLVGRNLTGFIQKPWSGDELVEALTVALTEATEPAE